MFFLSLTKVLLNMKRNFLQNENVYFVQ